MDFFSTFLFLVLILVTALVAARHFSYADWWKDSLEDNRTHASAGGILSDSTLRLHLYTSPSIALTGAETLGSFTEATGTGYASALLTGFAASTADGSTDYGTTANTVTFTESAAFDTVQGYYITNAGSTKLYWAEKFSSAVVMSATVTTIQVTPRLTRGTG